MSSIGMIGLEGGVTREGVQPERNAAQETTEVRTEAITDSVSIRHQRNGQFADAQELTLDQAFDALNSVRSLLGADTGDAAMVHELDKGRVYQLLGMA